MDRYKTAAGEGTAEISEKKSRFIAYVSPAGDEKTAASFIAGIKKKNYNATHNVFAYSVGLKGENVRQSDDGEPSGTAGVPILDILIKEEIRNCVIVVTRYFGGTLLGTGGLVRAYSKAAKEGLLAAGITERVLCVKYSLAVDYHTYGKVKFELENKGYKISDTAYAEAVTLELTVERGRTEELQKLVSEIMAGRGGLTETGRGYF